MTGKEEHHLPYDLENMSIPELEALLQQDFIASDGAAPDVDFIMAITEVIQKKEQALPDYQPMDAETAWEEFQSFYLTEEGGEQSIYRSGQDETPASDRTEQGPAPKGRKSLRKRFVIAALVAALLALTLIPVSGYANVLQLVIAYWTDNYFSFAPEGRNLEQNQDDAQFIVTKGFEELWEAAEKNGIHDLAIPQYIPEGFQVSDNNLIEYSLTDGFEFYILYTKGDDYISINIIRDGETPRTVYEKDNRNMSVYKLGDSEYYIFCNNGETVSSLFFNNTEYTFGTTLSEEKLKEIIDSMASE